MFTPAQRGKFFSEHTLFPIAKDDSFVDRAFSPRTDPVETPVHRPSGGRRKSLVMDPSYNFFQDRITLNEPGLIQAAPRTIAIFADLERILYYSSNEACIKLVIHELGVWKSSYFPVAEPLEGNVISLEVSEDDHHLLVIFEGGNAAIYSVITGMLLLSMAAPEEREQNAEKKWKMGQFSPDSRMLILTTSSTISIYHRDIYDSDKWNHHPDCVLKALHPILNLDFVDGSTNIDDNNASLASTSGSHKDYRRHGSAHAGTNTGTGTGHGSSMPETIILAALNATRDYSATYQHKRGTTQDQEASFRRYFLATACTHSLRVWDIRISKIDYKLTAEEVQTFTQEEEKFHHDFVSVGIAPHCRTLVIGHSNLNVSVWRSKNDNMRELIYYRELPLPSHIKSREHGGNRDLFSSTDSVQINVSKDIISTSYPVKYGTILIWDIKTGLLLHRMFTHDKKHQITEAREHAMSSALVNRIANSKSVSNLLAATSSKYAKVEPTAPVLMAALGNSLKTTRVHTSTAGINEESAPASSQKRPYRPTFALHTTMTSPNKGSNAFFQTKGFTMDVDGAVAVVVIVGSNVCLVRNNMHLYWKRDSFQFIQNPTDCPKDYLGLALLRDSPDLPLCEEKELYNVVAKAFQTLPANMSFLKEDDKFGIKSRLDMTMILQLPLNVLELMIDSDFFMHACIHDNLLTEFLGVETSLVDRIISIPRMKLIISVVLRSQQAQESLTLDGILVICLLLLSMNLSWTTQHQGALSLLEIIAIAVLGGCNCKLMHHQLHLIYFMIQQDIIGMYWKEYWNYIDISVIAFTWAFIVCAVFGGESFRLGVEYRMVAALTSGLIWIKLLGYIRLFGVKLATFILSLFQIAKDIRSFMIVLLIFMMGFANVFFIVLTPRLRTFEQASFHSVGESLLSMYRMMLGDNDRDWFHVSDNAHASRFMVFMFVIYSFFVTVILLNILIAVISDSYDYSMSNAQRIYMRAKLLSAAAVLTKNYYNEDYFRILQKFYNDQLYRLLYYAKTYCHNVSSNWKEQQYLYLTARILFGSIAIPLFGMYCLCFVVFLVFSLVAYLIFDRFFVFLVRKVFIPAEDTEIGYLEIQSNQESPDDMAWPGRALDMEQRMQKIVSSKINDLVQQQSLQKQQLEGQIQALQSDVQSMKSSLASIQKLLEMQQQPSASNFQKPSTPLDRVHELEVDDL